MKQVRFLHSNKSWHSLCMILLVYVRLCNRNEWTFYVQFKYRNLTFRPKSSSCLSWVTDQFIQSKSTEGRAANNKRVMKVIRKISADATALEELLMNLIHLLRWISAGLFSRRRIWKLQTLTFMRKRSPQRLLL